ncbi:DUF1761 domain-containing protein [Helicobacter brantae]|uniref:DUF1761 domain-containing protein n=1 Tax=Helicobacter brantae TaxID=375927 RepID=A0A3D8J1S4_9HELI|nr:DUF1761 domain-containing protein [Helicobacter brantae]RDU71467.1 hypothetical protein CQA58_02680 [Helicobacter brantae]
MIILLTLLSFFLGGLWFSPKLFGKIWCEGVNHQQNPNTSKLALFLGVFAINLSVSLLKVLSASFALKLSSNLFQYTLLGGIFIFLIASVHIQNLYFAKRSPKAIAVEFGYQALDLVMIFVLVYFLA